MCKSKVILSQEFDNSGQSKHDYYYVNMPCQNCDRQIFVHVLKGVAIINLPSVECPYCGCRANREHNYGV